MDAHGCCMVLVVLRFLVLMVQLVLYYLLRIRPALARASALMLPMSLLCERTHSMRILLPCVFWMSWTCRQRSW